MKKNETTGPAAIAHRIEELTTELATIETALTEAREGAAASLIAGADPLELQQSSQALRNRQTAVSGAITALRNAYKTALESALVDSARECGTRQQTVIAEHSAAVLAAMRDIGAVLDKLDAATAAANAKLTAIRVEALSTLGLAEGTPEAGQFRQASAGSNALAEIRRIVGVALAQ